MVVWQDTPLPLQLFPIYGAAAMRAITTIKLLFLMNYNKPLVQALSLSDLGSRCQRTTPLLSCLLQWRLFFCYGLVSSHPNAAVGSTDSWPPITVELK